jgi:hypothetical protein
LASPVKKETRAATSAHEIFFRQGFHWIREVDLVPGRVKTMETLLICVSGKKKRKRTSKRWSARVTKHSNALDLQPKVFRSRSPRKIALSLKRSAERSKRRKATPYQSAMSMLNFYINRAGENLPKSRKRTLERAKDELRDVFGRN